MAAAGQGQSGQGGISPMAMALLGVIAVEGFKHRDQLAGMLQGFLGGGSEGAEVPPTGAGALHGGSGPLKDATASAGGPARAGGAPTLDPQPSMGDMLRSVTTPGSSGGGIGDLLGGLGGMLGGLGGASSGKVVSGGLDDLIKSFMQSGQADAAKSWVGKGANEVIAPEQVEQAVGSDTVQALMQQTGLGRDELLSRLAQTLPRQVDELTPEGHMPTAQEIDKLSNKNAKH